jgi:hypothetical protein
MLTVYDDDEVIFDALCACACGYLLNYSRNSVSSSGAASDEDLTGRLTDVPVTTIKACLLRNGCKQAGRFQIRVSAIR